MVYIYGQGKLYRAYRIHIYFAAKVLCKSESSSKSLEWGKYVQFEFEASEASEAWVYHLSKLVSK